MPPRHDSRATATSRRVAAAASARKRKTADRSEGDDSDFDYTYNQRLPQPKQRLSKPRAPRPDRQYQHQAVPSLSSSDNSSPTASTFADGQESWRAELSDLKRTKKFTEEDRGFFFIRKKTTATLPKSSTAATIVTSKPGPLIRNFDDAENPLLLTPNPPLTPEGTPSRERVYDVLAPPNRSTKATSTKQNQQRPQRQQIQHTPKRNQDTVIAIPMRETPMINRNKDLRSASRRSSFNLRGKRASSIGNGFVAVPHPSVDPKYFFRHIAAEEPPPVRMRQLMAWCARKSIDSQKSSSQTALQVAKQIEEEALAMLTAGKFSVSWYTRPTDTEPIRAVPKKPHKRNMENLSKSRQYQAQIDKLRKEDEGWTRIISSFNTFHASVLDSGAALPPGDEAIILPEISADELNVELLSADDRSMWDKYCKHKDAAGTPGPATKARRDTIEGTEQSIKSNKWMQDMLGSLEKEVDNLQDTLYAASRFDKIAKQYTDQVLEQIAVALDERQRPPIMMGSSNLLNPWSSSPPTSSSIGKGETSSLRSTLASGAVSTSTSAEFILSPSIGPDSADDPWQILRALSRLSL